MFLQPLLANRNIERILLFCFVNESCYGSLLHTLLQVPLTPIQHALRRLEEGEVLISHVERKRKIYRLNPDYPLYSELQNLLRKCYTLLPPEEKRLYCFVHTPKLDAEKRGHLQAKKRLRAFFKRLSSVSELSFRADDQRGQATVATLAPTPERLIFEERGQWLENGSAFSNAFRWTMDLDARLITLEHLRYGADHAVFLLNLAPTAAGTLESVDAHFCSGDTYLGNVRWDNQAIDLHWRIIGPRKNQKLLYRYT